MEMYTIKQLSEMGADREYCLTYSDLYKEVYGTRPRGHMFSSVADFHSIYDRLCEELESVIEDDMTREEINYVHGDWS